MEHRPVLRLLRESAGQAPTDAFAASELPEGRRWDRVLALSRAGTTSEILPALESVRGRVAMTAITNSPGTPIVHVADESIVAEFADQSFVVATRSATTTLALLRASLGHDVEALPAQAGRALSMDLVGLPMAGQHTFLGRGWTVGIAHEAALRLREAAQVWTESSPGLEYRHGPISFGEPGRVVWIFGPTPHGLAGDVEATGASLVQPPGLDPMAQLVLAQRVAEAAARERGLDPDRPRHPGALGRSGRPAGVDDPGAIGVTSFAGTRGAS